MTKPPAKKVSKAVLKKLAKVTTPTITYQLMRLHGLHNTGLRDVTPLDPGLPAFAGPAFTLRYAPLRADLFDHLLRLPPSFYVRHRTGHVMSRCVNDVQNVQGLTGPVFLYLVETTILYVVGLTFMLWTNPLLTVVGIAPFPVFLSGRMGT